MGVTVNKDMITPSLKRISKQLALVPKQTYKEWVKNTPKKSGNARKQTKFKGKNKIVAKYPYVQRLDEGWSSQSPDGMYDPTGTYFNDIVKKIVRK